MKINQEELNQVVSQAKDLKKFYETHSHMKAYQQEPSDIICEILGCGIMDIDAEATVFGFNSGETWFEMSRYSEMRITDSDGVSSEDLEVIKNILTMLNNCE
jgi:hypothetical protein